MKIIILILCQSHFNLSFFKSTSLSFFIPNSAKEFIIISTASLISRFVSVSSIRNKNKPPDYHQWGRACLLCYSCSDPISALWFDGVLCCTAHQLCGEIGSYSVVLFCDWPGLNIEFRLERKGIEKWTLLSVYTVILILIKGWSWIKCRNYSTFRFKIKGRIMAECCDS